MMLASMGLKQFAKSWKPASAAGRQPQQQHAAQQQQQRTLLY
jgi:hypothetical protein